MRIDVTSKPLRGIIPVILMGIIALLSLAACTPTGAILEQGQSVDIPADDALPPSEFQRPRFLNSYADW